MPTNSRGILLEAVEFGANVDLGIQMLRFPCIFLIKGKLCVNQLFLFVLKFTVSGILSIYTETHPSKKMVRIVILCFG